MKLKFFSINALEPEADQEAVDTFCASHRLIAIDKRFVEQPAYCYWSICITYLDVSSSPKKLAETINKREQIDYRDRLNEADFAVFTKLRDLRKSLAETEGVPVYSIFTNAQLAEMVTERVKTQTALAALSGVGIAKLERYGKPFLNLLNDNLLQLNAPQVDEASSNSLG
ncbi:HRDC domain-containing protein [Thiothrix eikelboomii]|uniref:HRDC domain-containing protein n=1 Tax=Thiothrix eikelboomii TaxID=92487 RepID=A0A1T4X6Q3_9GAMM|nr:HRDC domain-containing protein [Thiothrix eikelboomii]SKA85313.1 HRDC domain-containing protein [Thiothrix eikelboomii]